MAFFTQKNVEISAIAALCLASFGLAPSGDAFSPGHRSLRAFANLSTRAAAFATKTSPDDFLTRSFLSSECDDNNVPPSLSIILRNMDALKSGSDIRGQFVDHSVVGSIASVAHAITGREAGAPAALTPFAAYCFGHAFASMLKESLGKDSDAVICIGRDPREHGTKLSDAISRGAENVEGIRVVYTGLATTPAMFEFARADKCDGGIMVTASHLPKDKNGLKFFTKQGGYTKRDINDLTERAGNYAHKLHDIGVMPPSSGHGAVFCSEHVDYMPHYAATLRDALVKEINCDESKEDQSSTSTTLSGLRIVLNAGNGAGYFFNELLRDLGADVSFSLHVEPDETFPNGVPNPENKDMVATTMKACEDSNADIGIMFDTDADRSGFIIPRTITPESFSDYEPLNRNRLIALLSVIFSTASPGCTIVTDSVTSEGLAKFLEKDLGLKHERYLKGYANVIGKAREITNSGKANAEMAIETSGHCAMRENGYLDDGTYTAVKVIGLLARVARSHAEDGAPHTSLLDLISALEEMPEENELRMDVLDGSLHSTSAIFDHASLKIEESCESGEIPRWDLDKENLEGVRVRTGNGGFFMWRKSLHDPLISLQVEGTSAEEIRTVVIKPLLQILKAQPEVNDGMRLSVLEDY